MGSNKSDQDIIITDGSADLTSTIVLTSSTGEAQFDGGVDALDFNGVQLTTGGAATNFLNETGAYSAVDTSALLALNNTWTGTNGFQDDVTISNKKLVFDDGALGNSVIEFNDGATKLWSTGADDELFYITNVLDSEDVITIGNSNDAEIIFIAYPSTFASTVDATSFNGVALTTGGLVTNFLNETGGYSVPPGGSGVELGDSPTWTGTHTFDLELNADGGINSTGDLPLSTTGDEQIRLATSKLSIFKNTIFEVGANSMTMLLGGNGGINLQSTGGAPRAEFKVDGSVNSFLLLRNSAGSAQVTLLADGNDSTFVQGVNAADFNGVALTTGGAATNYLDETGAYSVPPGGTDFFELFPQTVAQLNAASGSNVAGQLAWCTNDQSGLVVAYFDGTNWRRIDTNVIVATV